MTVLSLLGDLSAIGVSRSGGYERAAWTTADADCRAWFVGAAAARALEVETDRNGNLWAWRGADRAGTALVVGSHLDSVPNGGAYDGPLGVASAFAALDELDASGFVASRPLAVVAFADEEGARFGVACAGSRLLTGALDPDRARSLPDVDGVTMAEAMRASGVDPQHLGRDDERLAGIGEFIELHVEQGHLHSSHGRDGLAPDAPLGLATQIWPHGRWRVDLAGEQNHAGTTRLEDRRDPMLDLARVILGARAAAERAGVLATVGRVAVHPGAVNAIPGSVSAWIDARGASEGDVREALADLSAQVGRELAEESWTDATPFPEGLANDLGDVIRSVTSVDTPRLPSGAGHDAGVLSLAGIPTAMILVRNPSGISHAPEEHADDADCELGVTALAAVIRSRAS